MDRKIRPETLEQKLKAREWGEEKKEQTSDAESMEHSGRTGRSLRVNEEEEEC